MSYKIKRIYIKDFKLLKGRGFLYDFTGKNLIVLDGPNGYGKTTLFDSLELLFSGKIHRLDECGVTDRSVEQPDFYSDGFEIKIELATEESTVILGLKCKAQATNKRLLDWSNLEIYKLNNFTDEINAGDKLIREIQGNPGNSVGVDSLSQLLGEDGSLTRFFNYYYYIQQEESTFYLKNNEKDRSKEIESLFDTANEIEELNKLDKIYLLLSNYLKRKVDDKKALTDKLPAEVINQPEIEGNIEYKALLPKMENTPFWDVKELNNFSLEALARAKDDLKSIMELVKDFAGFKQYKDTVLFNNVLTRIIKDELLLKELTLGNALLDGFEDFNKQYHSFTELKDIYKKLISEDWIEELTSKDLDSVQNLVPNEHFDTSLIALRTKIFELHKSANQAEKLKAELVITRNSFVTQFESVFIDHKHKITNCPLCGNDWKSWENLKSSYELYEKLLQEQLDMGNKEFSDCIKEWHLKIKPVCDWIYKYVNNKKNYIDKERYQILAQGTKNIEVLKKCLTWLSDNKIVIEKFRTDDISIAFSLEEVEKIKLALTLEIKPLAQFQFNEKHNQIFDKYFASNLSFLENIEPEMISSKERYIEGKYYEFLAKKQQEIKKLEKDITTITELKDKTNNIKNKYKSEIIKHHQQILKNIEIPLFIYSGKILHGYKSEGSVRTEGIRMDDITTSSTDHKNLRLRFIPNIKGKAHDVTYTLSSGQISGLVIAFTLALNKIYGSKQNGIGFLLIDDPVQSMDDINMSALVDLLRQEFKDKQLILSTHEEDFSRYIRYKFHNFGLSYANVNMKDEYLKKDNS
jgi:exonuclease SbcC